MRGWTRVLRVNDCGEKKKWQGERARAVEVREGSNDSALATTSRDTAAATSTRHCCQLWHVVNVLSLSLSLYLYIYISIRVALCTISSLISQCLS